MRAEAREYQRDPGALKHLIFVPGLSKKDVNKYMKQQPFEALRHYFAYFLGPDSAGKPKLERKLRCSRVLGRIGLKRPQPSKAGACSGLSAWARTQQST